MKDLTKAIFGVAITALVGVGINQHLKKQKQKQITFDIDGVINEYLDVICKPQEGKEPERAKRMKYSCLEVSFLNNKERDMFVSKQALLKIIGFHLLDGRIDNKKIDLILAELGPFMNLSLQARSIQVVGDMEEKEELIIYICDRHILTDVFKKHNKDVVKIISKYLK